MCLSIVVVMGKLGKLSIGSLEVEDKEDLVDESPSCQEPLENDFLAISLR